MKADQQGRDEVKRREIEQVYPDLTYYYGLKPDEIAEMPRNLKQLYLDAIPRLQAGEQLRRIEASIYPWIDEKSQQSVQRTWRKHLPESAEDAPKLNPETMKAMAAMSGIAVVMEPKADTPADSPEAGE